MTTGEQAARRALLADLAHRWISVMQGRQVVALQPRRAVTIKSLACDGVDEDGHFLWFNDNAGSTHIRTWDQVRADLSSSPRASGSTVPKGRSGAGHSGPSGTSGAGEGGEV